MLSSNIGICRAVPFVVPSLTHWGRVTHICVNKLTIIGSDNGLSPGRRQAINWTNAGILLIGPLGTNFSEILIEIKTFSFKKMHLKMSGKWRPSCLGLNVLRDEGIKPMNYQYTMQQNIWLGDGKGMLEIHKLLSCYLLHGRGTILATILCVLEYWDFSHNGVGHFHSEEFLYRQGSNSNDSWKNVINVSHISAV